MDNCHVELVSTVLVQTQNNSMIIENSIEQCWSRLKKHTEYLYTKWDLTLKYIIIKVQDSVDKKKTLRKARIRKRGYKKQHQNGKGLVNIILMTTIMEHDLQF